MDHALTRPDYFTLTDETGQSVRGADQDWFREVWQRRAGCGPTAAAMILDYLSAVCPELADLAPAGGRTQADFLACMEALWDYVTPGTRGLDRPENFALGCRSYALSKGAVLDSRVLPIPRRGKGGRPDPDRVRTFLAEALDEDCPVAFLNWSNGDLPNLDSWHWVPLIACGGEGSDLTAAVLDGGEEKVIDLALWLRTSLLGGAFVRVYPDPAVYCRSSGMRDSSKEREP